MQMTATQPVTVKAAEPKTKGVRRPEEPMNACKLANWVTRAEDSGNS